jgi:hypothetical protein
MKQNYKNQGTKIQKLKLQKSGTKITQIRKQKLNPGTKIELKKHEKNKKKRKKK